MPRHLSPSGRRGRLLVAALGVATLGAAALTSTAGATGFSGAASASFDRHHWPPAHPKRPKPTPAPTTSAPTSTAGPTATAAPGTTPPPASTTAAPGTSAPAATTAAPAPGGFVPVDAAQWAADLAAFDARSAAPVPAGKARDVPEFHALCTTFHTNSDDPIVAPGLEGASHNHTFFGNRTTNYASTYDSLKGAGGTCAPAQDHSAYWVPTLYLDGQPVAPEEVTVYYGSRHTKDGEYKNIKPFPRGLRMIVGNSTQTTGTGNDYGFWCSNGERGRTADGVFPICEPGSKLIRYVLFPECWDGRNLDSPDHKSHMSQPVNGACPADHPVSVPTLNYTLAYPESVAVSDHGFTLASGGGSPYSMHGDFFNAWEPEALAQRVKDCLNQHLKCNSAGEM
jgi:hypothetical protein